MFGKIPKILILLIAFVCLQPSLKAATRLADVPAGASPAAVAVDAVRNKVFVANSADGSVTVIDGATKLTALVLTGSGPIDLAVNSSAGMVYVVNRDSDELTVLRADDNSIAATIPVGDFPLKVAVNPATNRVYVVNNASNSVTVIDGATNSVVATIPVLNSPVAIAVNPSTNKTYVANNFSGQVSVINAANAVTNVQVGGSPSSLAINQTTNRIYVTNETDHTVSAINGANDSVVATIPTGQLPHAIAINPVTNKIYVAVSESGVTVIDGANNSTATVATELQPSAIAVNATTNQIFVANRESDSVSVINGANNLVATLAAGAKPQDIAVNPVTNEAFSANFEGANVSVFEDAVNEISTAFVSTFSRVIAVNPATGKAYVGKEVAAPMVVIRPDNSTSTVNTQFGIRDIVVNPLTNKIYAVRSDAATVVVNGSDDSIAATVATGVNSVDGELNPVTNKIYVANANGASVTVIDGATNAATNVSVPPGPLKIAVNPVTNKIYVASTSGFVSVIDGATNAVTNIDLSGVQTSGVAVNPKTNKIYVAGGNSIESFEIDGATNALTPINIGGQTGALNVEVNPNTNKVYFSQALTNRITIFDAVLRTVSSFFSAVSFAEIRQIKANPATGKIYFLHSTGTLLELDDATGAQRAISAGTLTPSFDLDLLSNKIYIADRQSGNAFIVAKQNRQNASPSTTIAPLAGNTTNLPTPVFNLSAADLLEDERTFEDESEKGKEDDGVKGKRGEGELTRNDSFALSPFHPFAPSQITTSQQIYYQADAINGKWRNADAHGNALLPPLKPGLHVLYAFAADGQDSTATQTGSTSSPLVGKLSAYLFRVVPFAGSVGSNNQILIPNAGGAANPYPSTLAVSSVPGVIEKITVTLNQVSHGLPDNLDILLVSPTGEKMILMSDAGGADFALSLTTLIFDDNAPTRLPDDDFIPDGTFKPSNFVGGNDNFPAPAPPAPYANPGTENGGTATLNGTFGGISPNGIWKLFVVDDIGGSSGSIQGWSLTFQTKTDCPASSFTVSPLTANFGLQGGTGNASVAAPFGCIWNATSNNGFISISSNFIGIGSGSLGYTVGEANASRTGTMTIAGQTFTVVQQAPTAASVTIGGRILTPEGRALRNALVTLTSANGESRTVLTSAFGHYRFSGVAVGETYVLGAASKSYQFAPQAVLINEARDDLDLTANMKQ